MKKVFLAATLVGFLVAGAAEAADFMANSPDQSVNFIMDIIQRVLDMIRGFIGGILDEIVESIKEIISFKGDEK